MRNKQVTRIWKQWELVLLLLVLGWGLTLFSEGSAQAKGEATYKVVMSKNERLCSYIRDVLNKDLKTYGRGYDSHKFQDSVFQAISWTEVGKDFNYYGQVARFDINNDGQVDVVVRQETSGGRDVTFMKLFIFNETQFPEAAKKRKELTQNAIGSVDIFPAYIFPLLFEKTTYLLVTKSPDSTSLADSFEIAKYKGGKVGRGGPDQLEDVCFLK